MVAAVLCAQDKETFAHADAFESGTNPPDNKKRGRTSVTYTDGQLTHYNLRTHASMLPINYLSGFLRAANEVKVQIDVFNDLGMERRRRAMGAMGIVEILHVFTI